MQEQQFENFGACREVKFHRARSLKRSRVRPSSSSDFRSGVKNGSARVRAARPFYPQEQTSSACPNMSVWCQAEMHMCELVALSPSLFQVRAA
jgi:hypothetical protein